MGCGGSKLPNMSASSKAFMTMISTKPTLTKYLHKMEKQKTLLKGIASTVYGGSVLLPVGAK